MIAAKRDVQNSRLPPGPAAVHFHRSPRNLDPGFQVYRPIRVFKFPGFRFLQEPFKHSVTVGFNIPQLSTASSCVLRLMGAVLTNNAPG